MLSVLVGEYVAQNVVDNLVLGSQNFLCTLGVLMVMDVFYYVISLFTIRELAIGFWLVFILLYILFCKNIRKSFFNFIKGLFSKPLRTINILMTIYFVLITFCFTKLYTGEAMYFKDAILWLLFNVFFVFHVLDKSSSEKYIKNYLRSNICFLVCISYLVDSFTFNFLFELVTILLIVLLTCVECIFNNDSKNKDVYIHNPVRSIFVYSIYCLYFH